MVRLSEDHLQIIHWNPCQLALEGKSQELFCGSGKGRGHVLTLPYLRHLSLWLTLPRAFLPKIQLALTYVAELTLIMLTQHPFNFCGLFRLWRAFCRHGWSVGQVSTGDPVLLPSQRKMQKFQPGIYIYFGNMLLWFSSSQSRIYC